MAPSVNQHSTQQCLCLSYKTHRLHFTTQLHCTSVQVHKAKSVQMHKCTSAKVWKCTSVQVQKYVNQEGRQKVNQQCPVDLCGINLECLQTLINAIEFDSTDPNI